MNNMLAALERRLAALPVSVTVDLPSGQRIGPEHAQVRVTLRSPAAFMALAQGQIGSLGAAVVEGWVDLQGSMRNVMAVANGLLQTDPLRGNASWWSQAIQRAIHRAAGLYQL